MYRHLLDIAPSQEHWYTVMAELVMARMKTGHKEWYVRRNSGKELDMELAKEEAHMVTEGPGGSNMGSLVCFVAEAESRTIDHVVAKAVSHSSEYAYKMIV